MDELWSSASYEPRLLSLPFAFAPAAFAIVIAYGIAMRGARSLRTWMLLHCCALLPYSVVVALSASTKSADAAEQLYRFGASFIPLAAAAGTGFQLALIRRYRKYRVLVWLGMASAFAWVIIGSLTNAAVSGVHRLPVGMWYASAGPWAAIALVHTFLVSVGGFVALAREALFARPSQERRQLRHALAANVITYAGLVDVLLAYDIGTFPVGWLLSGVGSLLVLRAILVEDLLRVRAVDTAAPRLVAHFAAGALLAWVALARVGGTYTWWGVTLTLVMCFAGVRVAIGVIGLVNRGARGNEGPLDRLINQFVTRSRTMTEGGEIAKLATEVVELGVGMRPLILVGSEDDYGFTLPDGTPIPDQEAPDPLLGAWLVEHHRTVFAADPEAEIPPDLAPALETFFENNAHARAVVPVRSGDELVALIVVPRDGARVRGPGLAFLERIADRLAEALIHARMAVRAAERAAVAGDVALARNVQTELLPPSRQPQHHGGFAAVGSWRPATSCAGDFWGIYPLDERRVLLAIGDVTGHGVASAMVTAAAVGACDAAARRAGGALKLDELVAALDASVRRVGGGELAMTCFAAVIDHVDRRLSYVSCGHTAPYLWSNGTLAALVGRGNPLGGAVPATPKLLDRTLAPGDLVVWYTDGVIDAQDPAGKPFGDRRLQMLLRKLDPAKATPGPVHDAILASVGAHRAGRALADDETVVVGQL